jgi:HEAT repeat protein
MERPTGAQNSTAALIALIAILCLHVAKADDYKWKEGNASSREIYSELSDSEFTSLNPAPTKFPMLLDAWKDRALISDDVRTPALRYARDADVDRQEAGFVQPDPRFRSRTGSILAGSQSPRAIPLLLAQYGKETDAWTRADLLRALVELNAKIDAGQLRSSLEAALPAERTAAVRLLIAQKESDREVAWKMAAVDSAPEVRLAALRALAVAPKPAELENWLVRLTDDVSIQTITVAARAVMATPGVSLEAAAKTIAARPPYAAVNVAEALPANLPTSDHPALLLKLLASPHPSVQAAAAVKASTRTNQTLEAPLLALEKSPTAEVRRAVALALQQHPGEASFTALINLAGDPVSELVRTAARESLIAMAGQHPVAEQIGAHVDDASELRREQLYQVAGRLRATAAAGAMADNFDTETNPANIAQLLRGLADVGYAAVAEKTPEYAAHESPRVRSAVA